VKIFSGDGGECVLFGGEGRDGAGNKIIKIDPLDHVRETGFISLGTMS